MRRVLAGIVLSAAVLVAGAAPSSAGAGWTPDEATIAKLEASIAIPDLPKHDPVTVANYVRYYAGVKVDGLSAVRGTLVMPSGTDVPGVKIVRESELPKTPAAGCEIVSLIYDVKHDNIAWIKCAGDE